MKLNIPNTSKPEKLAEKPEPLQPKPNAKLQFNLKGQNVAPKVKVENPRDILYGTGFTKKVVLQMDKALDKAVEAGGPSRLTGEAASQLQAGQVQETVTLPTTLMADDLVLDEFQAAAVDGLVNEKYGVLIGAAGTGKTTTLKSLIAGIEQSMQRIKVKDLTTANKADEKNELELPAIAFCSFTGKAVQQMKRALPSHFHPLCNTIHATLGYAPVKEEREVLDEDGVPTGDVKNIRVFRPTYNKTLKLPYKFICIDETGTLSVNLWHELLDACTDDCRIFFIGDLNQLPPVNGHSILGFAMLKWPTFALEKLHRQAAGDPIAENAHRILSGKKPLQHESKLFNVREIADGSSAARMETLAVIQHLHKNGEFDPMQDALIVPQNIGALGQIELNKVLVNYFNPPRFDPNAICVNPRTIIVVGGEHAIFAVGDKVMLLKNNNEMRLTNGMMGVVTSITNNAAYQGERIAFANEADESELDWDGLADLQLELKDESDIDKESERQASHIMTVVFQNVVEEVTFETAGAFKTLAHGYAMTCHKAQGSEYNNVVVLAHASNMKMLCREWLYTAITRAKKRVFLLTNNRGLTQAVNVQKIKGNTIKEKAEKFLSLQKREKDEQEVRLPIPDKIVSMRVQMRKVVPNLADLQKGVE